MRRLGVVLLLVVASASALATRERLDRLSEVRDRESELLYLPNGKYLRLMSLGHSSLLADWLYIWAIQYYSDYERSDRYRYVEHIFGQVIAELDPHYVDSYWLGALIMIVEAKDLEAGLRLLDKGIENNPEQWVLPYLAGWECYHAGQLQRSSDYFAIAAGVPGAPRHIERIRAGVIARAGDLEGAWLLWREILDDPSSDPATKAIAGRKIRNLKVRLDLEDLTAAVEAFRKQENRYPRELGELIRSGIVSTVPLDPDGNPYAYDPTTGRVSSDAARLLGGGG